MIGVATAPASRVEVMTQVALPGEVFSSSGRSLMTGTSRVCITATTMPAKASTGTIPAPVAALEPSPIGPCAGSWAVVVWGSGIGVCLRGRA